MFMDDVGSVYVVDGKSMLTGVVSRKDLLKAATNNNGDLRDLPVMMVMTPLSKIVMVRSEDTLASAARKAIDNEIDSLPVVKPVDAKAKTFQLIGRITKTNFTRVLVDLAEGKGGNYHSK
jgi:CBS domain-containing protein